MMQADDLYKDIADRTQGDVYIGVVGPVRTGKSTSKGARAGGAAAKRIRTYGNDNQTGFCAQ